MIVVGAGIVGCAIARELALRGVACTVIDPRPIAGGATQASAGMLAPYVEAHHGGPMLELCVRSLDLYDKWIASLRREGHEVEYRRIGTLEVALTLEHAAELRQSEGEWIPTLALASRVPRLTLSAGALRNDQHGYVDAPQLAAALAASAVRHGASFRTGRVQRIDQADRTLRVRVGSDEQLEASTVIVAAGAWTNLIAGIVSPPVRPVRGQLLYHAGGIGRIETILWGPDCYIVPRENGTLLIGATVEEVGFDEQTTDRGINALFEAARRLLRALSRDSIEGARVGLRPATPDDLPALGRHPQLPGLVYAVGHYRNGVLLAPITGKLIADLVIDGRVDPALEIFRPDRF